MGWDLGADIFFSAAGCWWVSRFDDGLVGLDFLFCLARGFSSLLSTPVVWISLHWRTFFPFISHVVKMKIS